MHGVGLVDCFSYRPWAVFRSLRPNRGPRTRLPSSRHSNAMSNGTSGAAGAFLEVHLQLAALGMPVMLAALAVPLGEVWGDNRNTTIAAGVISFPNQQTVKEQ